MRLERQRDNQQWLLDWIVNTTGRVINFAYDQRIVPPEVKSYAMIPRIMERQVRHEETLARAAPRVECPSLQVVGEYDPLAPLDDVLAVYRLVPPPKEIWVCENDFHVPRGTANFGHADFYGFLANWLRDALEGRMPRDLDKGVLVGQKDGPGPYGEPVRGVHLPERLGLDHTGPTAAQRGPAGIREGWRIAPQNKKAPADAADAFS
jgi:hypothetical protein